MKANTTDIIMQNKIFAWIGLATGFILALPLIAMQFSSEVDWKLGDFIIMGTLIFGMGSIFVLTARKIQSNSNRIMIGIAFLCMLLYLWAELAVGIFTNWGS